MKVDGGPFLISFSIRFLFVLGGACLAVSSKTIIVIIDYTIKYY